MNQGAIKNCPKCGGQMKSGRIAGDFRVLKEGDLYGDRTYAKYCRNCGFVELYKEPSTRDLLRRTQTPEPELQVPTSKSEEPLKPEKEEPDKKAAKRLVR